MDPLMASMALMAEVESATPETGEEPIVPAAGSEAQSAGTASWVEWSVEPGPHRMACWVPDRASGTPHSFMGMTSFLEVA